jgi:hypothetical protein
MICHVKSQVLKKRKIVLNPEDHPTLETSKWNAVVEE